jgi:hypothetical protein
LPIEAAQSTASLPVPTPGFSLALHPFIRVGDFLRERSGQWRAELFAQNALRRL